MAVKKQRPLVPSVTPMTASSSHAFVDGFDDARRRARMANGNAATSMTAKTTNVSRPPGSVVDDRFSADRKHSDHMPHNTAALATNSGPRADVDVVVVVVGINAASRT